MSIHPGNKIEQACKKVGIPLAQTQRESCDSCGKTVEDDDVDFYRELPVLRELELKLSRGSEDKVQIVTFVYGFDSFDSFENYDTCVLQFTCRLDTANDADSAFDLAERFDPDLVLSWQEEHDGALPYGIVRCIVPYTVMQSDGASSVTGSCCSALIEVTERHREPPSDIDRMPFDRKYFCGARDHATAAELTMTLISHPKDNGLHPGKAALRLLYDDDDLQRIDDNM